MSYTQEQADALRAAIARGARKLRMNGEEVEYHSLAAMRSLLTEMERNLATVPATRQHYPIMSRGT